VKPLFVVLSVQLISVVAAGSIAVAARASSKPAKSSASSKPATAVSPMPPPSAQDLLVDRERRRLEELFIWKISEELKLPVEMETSFAEAIRSLNREKARANADVAKALDELNQAQNAGQSKARAETERAVRKYEQAWKTYGALPLREVSRMRAILGSERLGKYLIAKSQMAEKLKALSAREATEKESAKDSEAPASGAASLPVPPKSAP
jgi:hypothetical protein